MHEKESAEEIKQNSGKCVQQSRIVHELSQDLKSSACTGLVSLSSLQDTMTLEIGPRLCESWWVDYSRCIFVSVEILVTCEVRSILWWTTICLHQTVSDTFTSVTKGLNQSETLDSSLLAYSNVFMWLHVFILSFVLPVLAWLVRVYFNW